jgi:Ca-activated chloride channel family protein
LVAFHNGQPEVVLNGVSAKQRSVIEEALAQLGTPAEVNLIEGLRQAVAAARQVGLESAMRQRIVVLSDADLELTDDARGRLDPVLRQSTALGATVWVAALAEDGEPSELLRYVASGRGGQCSPLATSLDVDRFLTEALRDQPCRVAEDVHLSITFNPKTVASYRLIGHEATSVLGVHTAELDLKLSAGETCTGLFEVQLRDGGDDLVGTVEMTWRKPLQTDQKRATRRISRWQLADSFLETPPSVQTAALSAETAEILRDSRFAAGRGHSWVRVRQVAAEAHPQASQSDSFRRLMELVQRAQEWGGR